ncbi:Endoribonuclease L-PSP [Balamuthia mandrillaris]
MEEKKDSQTPEQRLQEAGITLLPVPKFGLYVPVTVVGNLAYTSGQVPLLEDGTMMKGKLGDGVELEAGRAAARQCGIMMLSALHARVKRVIKLTGFVNCTPDFEQQPAVINGCSELMKEIFGEENGAHARSAVGSNALPLGITCEVEGIFEIYSV